MWIDPTVSTHGSRDRDLGLASKEQKSILMKNLNVTLKSHGGQVRWDGAGQIGSKQGVVYMPPRVFLTGSELLVIFQNFRRAGKLGKQIQ